ncbi:hypothetical protein AX16_004311 [Volvariella volvacea WC 439]|nr:hypothetical protein AX16_004311 [Volvariella volvacea WC 439]
MPLRFNIGGPLRHRTAGQTCIRTIVSHHFYTTTIRAGSASSSNARLQKEGLQVDIRKDEHEQMIERAKSVWPSPSHVPSGWSSAWEDWPHLLTFYWFSPYFLMLPQIEMVVNICHRIPGETRPLLFSTESERFIFTLVKDPKRFFVFDIDKQELHEIEGAGDENALAKKMANGWRGLKTKIIPQDPEGVKAIERIMDRDESVIPVLAKEFLDYTPTPTHKWEEGMASGQEDMNEEEVLRKIEELVKDLERAEKEQAKR